MNLFNNTAYAFVFSFAHEQVVDEYESIDTRLNDLLRYIIIIFIFHLYISLIFRSANITAEKIGDFSFEIEHLESRLDNLNKLLDSNELKVFFILFNHIIYKSI